MDFNDKSQNISERPTILASFKMIITEWFLSSTAHALPNIFRTGNILLKIIWLCCFLASATYCVISIIKTLNDFYTYPSYISTKIIQEIPTQFPAISICNMKSVNKTRSQSYLDSLNLTKFDSKVGVPPLVTVISLDYQIRTAIVNDLNLTETKRKAIGFELKDMLISCYFNNELCNLNDFTYIYDSRYGNCYTFNKGVFDNGTTREIKTVSLTGPLYGLILELFLGDPKVDTYLESSDGILVSIHNQSSVPFTKGDKIKVAAGSETDLIVNRNFISKIEAPHGDCLKDTSKESKSSSFYFDYLVRKLGVEYSQETCFGLCVQKKIMDTCNCSNTWMPVFNTSTRFCLNYIPELKCRNNVLSSFSKSTAPEECKKACPYECDSIDYDISTYRALYPTDYYTNILYDYLINNRKINVSLDNIGKSVVKVNIYYKSMEYLSTQQMISISTEDFFSNIGGTLGLYIGISILSLIEVVELGFNLMLVLISSIKSKKQISQN